MPRPCRSADSRPQVVHRAELRCHRAVVGHRVAAVVLAVARLEYRHQVEVGDPEIGEVVEPMAYAAQRSRVPVGVGGVPEHAAVLEPVRAQRSLQVEAAQGRAPVGVRLPGERQESDHQVVDRVGRVHRAQPVLQLGMPTLDAQLEPVVGLHLRHPSDSASGSESCHARAWQLSDLRRGPGAGPQGQRGTPVARPQGRGPRTRCRRLRDLLPSCRPSGSPRRVSHRRPCWRHDDAGSGAATTCVFGMARRTCRLRSTRDVGKLRSRTSSSCTTAR